MVFLAKHAGEVGSAGRPDVALDIRYAELSDDVRPFAANIYGQIHDVLARYAVEDIAAFQKKMRIVGRRELLQARGDVGRLIALTKKLKFLLDEAKPLENAFEDRHHLLAVVKTVRAALDCMEPEVPPAGMVRILSSLIIANLFLGRDTVREVEELCSTPGFDDTQRKKLEPCVRALGVFHDEENAERVCTIKGLTGDVGTMLRAVYATALPDEFFYEREQVLEEVRSAMTTVDDLAQLAHIELDAGHDVGVTLARIETLRRSGALQDSESAASLYARLGDEKTVGTMVSYLNDDSSRDGVWGELARYHAKKGDLPNVERVFGEMLEPWNALDIATDVLLPVWIARKDWGNVDGLPPLECMRSLCSTHPELVEAYYTHLDAESRTPHIEAIYARHLSAQGNNEQFLLHKDAFLKKVEDAIRWPVTPDSDDWDIESELEQEFAEYLLATQQRGEPAKELLTLLYEYLRETSRNEEGRVVASTYNIRSSDVMRILLAVGATDIAMRIVDHMYDVDDLPRNRNFGDWTDKTPEGCRADVYTRMLDDAIARVRASVGVLQRLEEKV